MNKITTIKDIAIALGISTSTVSRILNGKNTSNSKLAEQVLATARELNYQVNTAAKGLRTNKTGMIGIIVPEIGDDFFGSVLSGMEEIADANKYNLLLCQSNESHDKEIELVNSLIACNVEGIVISVSKETQSLDFLNPFLALGKKVVVFDRTLTHPEIPAVIFNDWEGTTMAAEHLIETGHKSFLYVGLDKNLQNNKDRLSGYNQVLSQSNLPLCEEVYLDQWNFTSTDFKEIWNNKYDAIVCFNDVIAARILSIAHEIDLKIPEQASVVGFDNRLYSQYTFPKLTTVEHSTRGMGKHVINLLTSLLNDTEIIPVEMSTELVLRDTTIKR